MDEQLLGREIDELYGVAMADFVPERDRRAKALRQDGNREEAVALKKARKPTVAAWAVNQVARSSSGLVEELLEAGDELRTRQQRAASGAGAGGLRDAARRVRDLAGRAAAAAGDILDEAGGSESHLADVERTFFAAASDPDLRDTLRRGIFERPTEAVGFGEVPVLMAVPDAPADEETGEVEQAAADGDAEAREKAEREEAARREAERRALERQRSNLRKSLERRQRKVDRTAQMVTELRERLEKAQADLQGAHDASEDVANELAEVERQLTALDEPARA